MIVCMQQAYITGMLQQLTILDHMCMVNFTVNYEVSTSTTAQDAMMMKTKMMMVSMVQMIMKECTSLKIKMVRIFPMYVKMKKTKQKGEVICV